MSRFHILTAVHKKVVKMKTFPCRTERHQQRGMHNVAVIEQIVVHPA